MRISRITTVTVTAASTVAVVIAHRSSPVAALALAGGVITLGVLADIDVRTHRLPNRIVGPLAVAGVVGVLLAGLVADDVGRSFNAIAAGAAATGLMLVLNIVGGLGMGDVKLSLPIATVAGWFGATAIATTGLVAALSAGVAGAIVLAVTRDRKAEFGLGPCLALGAVAGIVSSGTW